MEPPGYGMPAREKSSEFAMDTAAQSLSWMSTSQVRHLLQGIWTEPSLSGICHCFFRRRENRAAKGAQKSITPLAATAGSIVGHSHHLSFPQPCISISALDPVLPIVLHGNFFKFMRGLVTSAPLLQETSTCRGHTWVIN